MYLEAPYEEIIIRNSDRDKPVPEKIIEKLIDKLEVPDVTEAHEVLWWDTKDENKTLEIAHEQIENE